MQREHAVQEDRYVVEVEEPVPAEAVTDIAGRVAARLRMDPARVHKLLDGRVGPVTKPLGRAKAEAILHIFEDAGVNVTIRPAHEGDEALAAGRPVPAPAAPPEPAPAAPPEAAAAEPDPRPGPADGAATGPTGAPPAAARPGLTPPSMFVSSTRWVPSPHDDFGFEPLDQGEGEEEPDPDEAPERFPTAPYATPPRERGPDLRGYLLIGLGLSLVLLLVLQIINAGRARSPEPTATVEVGMDAYRAGDFARAQRVWQPLADAGNPRAQYMLGYMAENGQGRAWSNHDAAEEYGRAAAQGLPEAQIALGELYHRGMGVSRDEARAAELYRRAAESGFGPGQLRYAEALFQGEGVQQDFGAALRWFRAAAENGVDEARAYVSFAATQGEPSTAATTASP